MVSDVNMMSYCIGFESKSRGLKSLHFPEKKRVLPKTELFSLCSLLIFNVTLGMVR
uniref:Uncharacterized protein n=1 Tax=Amphimedon queenslandica TaxID=400682 RepID=A0A1X7VUV8_AMPQE